MPETIKQRRRDATVEVIVEAAESAMTHNGFDSVTMRDIAVQAGCAPATLYQYFTNKQELLDAIVEQHSAEVLRLMRSAMATTDDPVEKLRLRIQCAGEYRNQNRAVIRLIHTSAPHAPGDPASRLPPSARAEWEAFWQEEVKLVKAGQQQGRIRQDFDAEVIQRYMRRVAHTLFEEFSAQDPQISQEEQLRIVWGLLAGGMGIWDE